MSARVEEPRSPEVPAAGRVAAAVVSARWPIVVFWIVAVVLAVTQLPSLSGGSAISDIVPAHAPALATQSRAIALFGAPIGSDVVVVQRRAGGLRASDIARHGAAASRALARGGLPGAQLRGVVPLVNTLSSSWHEHGTTIVDYLLIDGSVAPLARVQIGQRYARSVGATDQVTGSTAAQLDELTQIDDVLPWVTIATILVIALVVTLYFRSLLAPLVTLGTAGLAYLVATHALSWAGQQLGFTVPQAIEPLLVVFLLGLVTDYTVFFLAQARRRTGLGDAPLDAARAATSRVAPSVLAAGMIVAACSCALLAAHLEFFRAFGPGLAGCALVVTLVAVTLVPALMAILGARLVGAAAAEGESEPTPETPMADGDRRLRLTRLRGAIGAGRAQARAEGRSSVGPIAARMLASRPVAVLLVVLCVAGLGLAAGATRQTRLDVASVTGLPASSAAHRAAASASRGFVAGILAPTDIVLQGPGVGRRRAATERLRAAIATRRGVAVTLGPSVQAALNHVPRANHMFAAASGNAARIVVVFDHDPGSAATLASFRRLQHVLPRLARHAGLPASTRISYAGETALGVESVTAVSSDFVRIAILAAAIILVLLMVFLRAFVAPVLLLGASALGFVAALGLTTLAVRGIYGDFQITYYVPLVGMVILVALGSDYNVLVAGRIRAESARRRPREAVAVAVPEASRAINIAGLTLAGTFAMLAIVPLRSFRELALLLVIGVLLDTTIVRSVLVPGLIVLAGRHAWAPGRASTRRPSPIPAFAATPDAEATLAVLGERIGRRDAGEVGARLPANLAEALRAGDGRGRFDAEEFVRRVAQRTDVPAPDARQAVASVFASLRETLGETEFAYIRAALSQDYGPLLDEGHATVELPAVSARPLPPATRAT
jgi:putative drug exporter of the RND superfamily